MDACQGTSEFGDAGVFIAEPGQDRHRPSGWPASPRRPFRCSRARSRSRNRPNRAAPRRRSEPGPVSGRRSRDRTGFPISGEGLGRMAGLVEHVGGHVEALGHFAKRPRRRPSAPRPAPGEPPAPCVWAATAAALSPIIVASAPRARNTTAAIASASPGPADPGAAARACRRSRPPPSAACRGAA